MRRSTAQETLRVVPVTPDRWADLVRLFGSRGACGGCWCMTPRLPRSQYERQKGEGNKKALQALVESGRVPGVLVYAGSTPVGWCSIEPREAISGLARSRILAPVDDQPVWSIVCLFVAKEWRRKGVSRALIDGATAWARERGATIVEAYPVEPKKTRMPDVFAYTGLVSTFRRAGFREVARRSPTRPIMRKRLS
jgi:GNAT superfamily N-acetyltransferase